MALGYNYSMKDKNQDKMDIIMEMLLNMDGTLLRYVENPTYDMFLSAVKQDGMSIYYIPAEKQTEEIKMEAIRSDPFCFEFIDNPTIPMWKEMILRCNYVRSDHPIHMLKDDRTIPEIQKIYLYKYYIETREFPASSVFHEIIHDITESRNIECEMWKYYLSNYYYDYPFIFDMDRCPNHVLDVIIDDVFDYCPYILENIDEKYETPERVVKYLTYKFRLDDLFNSQSFEEYCKKYPDETSYRIAQDVVENVLSDRRYYSGIKHFKNTYFNKDKWDDIGKDIMIAATIIPANADKDETTEANNKKICEMIENGYFELFPNNMSFVLKHVIEFEDIIKYMREHDVVYEIINRLPWYKKHKYLRILKKYKKNKNKGTFSKIQIHHSNTFNQNIMGEVNHPKDFAIHQNMIGEIKTDDEDKTWMGDNND